MKKRMRLITMILVACIFVANTTTVFAARKPNTGISVQWSDVSTILSEMTVDSWGVATVSASGQAKSSSSADSVELIVDLQKYENGSWNTIKTWTDKKDVKFAAIYEKYAIAKGYSYRLNITVNAYKGNSIIETASDIYYYGLYKK